MKEEIKKLIDSKFNLVLKEFTELISDNRLKIETIEKRKYLDNFINRQSRKDITLNINERNFSITSSPLPGQNFPEQFGMVPNQTYYVDYATLNIPIDNGYYLNISSRLINKSDSIYIENGTLKITICSYVNNLKSNDTAIGNVQSRLKELVDKINLELIDANIYYKNLMNSLPQKLESLFDNKINDIKQLESALKKIDPFL